MQLDMTIRKRCYFTMFWRYSKLMIFAIGWWRNNGHYKKMRPYWRGHPLDSLYGYRKLSKNAGCQLFRAFAYTFLFKGLFHFLAQSINSTRSRCVECLGNGGGQTHYCDWIVELNRSCELRFRPLLCLIVCKRITLCPNQMKFSFLMDEILNYICTKFHSLGFFGLENMRVYANCA